MSIQDELELEKFKKFNKGQDEVLHELNKFCFDQCSMTVVQFLELYKDTKEKLKELELKCGIVTDPLNPTKL